MGETPRIEEELPQGEQKKFTEGQQVFYYDSKTDKADNNWRGGERDGKLVVVREENGKRTEKLISEEKLYQYQIAAAEGENEKAEEALRMVQQVKGALEGKKSEK